jgi:hypothetical protein
MAWQVAAAFQVAGGLGSARAKRKASRAAKREAEAQAAEFRRQTFEVAQLATEQHEQRSEQFKELAAYNEAMAAFMGRTGRSISALRKEEERRYGRDVNRLRAQEEREKQKLEKQAETTLARGRVTSDIYKAQAKASLLNTAFAAASLYQPPGAKATIGGTSSGGGTGVNVQSSKTGMSPKVVY